MTSSSSKIGLISILVDEYDTAIEYFTNKLGFTLTADTPSLTNAGKPKRWVVVHRAGQDHRTSTGIVLAQAEGEEQRKAVGKQWAGRVGMFLNVDDFDREYAKFQAAGVEFLSKPKEGVYGKFAVFQDICGNKWDLIQPYD